MTHRKFSPVSGTGIDGEDSHCDPEIFTVFPSPKGVLESGLGRTMEMYAI